MKKVELIFPENSRRALTGSYSNLSLEYANGDKRVTVLDKNGFKKDFKCNELILRVNANKSISIPLNDFNGTGVKNTVKAKITVVKKTNNVVESVVIHISYKPILLCCLESPEEFTFPKNKEKIRYLYCGDCKNVKQLDQLEGLDDLEHIELHKVQKVSNYDILGTLTSLKSITLNQCHQLTKIDFLPSLTNLVSLNLGSALRLRNITPILMLQSLEKLVLNFCLLIDDLTPTRNLNSVEVVDCYSLD